MFIAKIDNGIPVEFPISERDFRKRFSNISLPKHLTEESVSALGYAIVPEGSTDSFPNPTKDYRVELEGIYNDAGVWKRKYVLQPVDPIIRASRLAKKWREVRAKRDELMKNFEWRISRYNRETALGLPPTDNINALHTYMQQLADITTQDDPFLINYPIIPE